MNTKNIVIGGLVAVALIFGVMAYKSPSVITVPDTTKLSAVTAGPQGPQGPQGPAGRDGRDGVTKVVTQVVQAPTQEVKLGALSGPDIPYPYLSVSGVRKWDSSMTVRQASTTLCALQAPVSTSTLRFATLQLRTSSTSQMMIDIARAASAYATTTKIGSTITNPANAQISIFASTTSSTGYGGGIAGGSQTTDDTLIFPPSYWLVIKAGFSGPAGSGTAPIGTCTAEWAEF